MQFWLMYVFPFGLLCICLFLICPCCVCVWFSFHDCVSVPPFVLVFCVWSLPLSLLCVMCVLWFPYGWSWFHWLSQSFFVCLFVCSFVCLFVFLFVFCLFASRRQQAPAGDRRHPGGPRLRLRPAQPDLSPPKNSHGTFKRKCPPTTPCKQWVKNEMPTLRQNALQIHSIPRGSLGHHGSPVQRFVILQNDVLKTKCLSRTAFKARCMKKQRFRAKCLAKMHRNWMPR